MCRMLIASGKIDLNPLLEGMILMAKDQTKIHELNEEKGLGTWIHKDGWGIAYLDEDKEWQIYRSTLPIFKDPETDKFRTIKTNQVMIHSRFKMGSGIAIKNTHPFIFKKNNPGTFVFCHNGFIDEQIIFDKKHYSVSGETDSEKLFYSILTDLKRFKLSKAIRRNFKKYKKITGTNIILTSNKKTVIATRENKFPRYYQMSMAQNESLRIFSSEPLPNMPQMSWQPLEMGEIIEINHKRGALKRHKLKSKGKL